MRPEKGSTMQTTVSQIITRNNAVLFRRRIEVRNLSDDRRAVSDAEIAAYGRRVGERRIVSTLIDRVENQLDLIRGNAMLDVQLARVGRRRDRLRVAERRTDFERAHDCRFERDRMDVSA